MEQSLADPSCGDLVPGDGLDGVHDGGDVVDVAAACRDCGLREQLRQRGLDVRREVSGDAVATAIAVVVVTVTRTWHAFELSFACAKSRRLYPGGTRQARMDTDFDSDAAARAHVAEQAARVGAAVAEWQLRWEITVDTKG